MKGTWGFEISGVLDKYLDNLNNMIDCLDLIYSSSELTWLCNMTIIQQWFIMTAKIKPSWGDSHIKSTRVHCAIQGLSSFGTF